MADFDINVTGTIADDSVTNAKLAPVPNATFKGGPVRAGLDNPVDMTPDQASTILDAATDPFVRTSAAQPLDADLTAYANAADAAARRVLIDLGNVPNVDATNPANITQDATHRFTTDAEKATWNALIGGSVFQTVWNATTNSPSLVSSIGTKGHYYIVNVAGSTNLDGITDWKVGDWAIFDGTVWRKVDNTDAVASVNGLTGAVVLDTSNVADTSNKRYVTDAQLVVIGNTSGINSGDETTTTIGSLINGATSKTTPVDADELPLVDSAASNVLKKLSWANIKATLKTYFDAIYVTSGGALGTPSSGTATNLTGTASGLTAGLAVAMTKEVVTRITSDFSTSSTTLVDVTGGTAAMLANKDYIVEVDILFQSTVTTTGLWLALNGPASPTSVSYQYHIPVSAVAFHARIAAAYDAGSATTDVAVANTTYYVKLFGFVRNGANAGNLQLRLAAENANAVSIRTGTRIKLTQTN